MFWSASTTGPVQRLKRGAVAPIANAMRVLPTSLLICAAALSGCDDGPDRAPDDAAGEGGAGVCPTERFIEAGDADCDTGRGGPMRRIPLAGGGTMCIDQTEVTVEQYQAFLASAEIPALPSADPAAARCAADTHHEPTCFTDPCEGVGCDMPQPCVSQCDAKLFCEWAGKKLCGPVGTEPLGIDRPNLLDPTKNQWRNACSPDGREWPYGPDYDPQACNTTDRQPAACGGPAVTASFPNCQAPEAEYGQIFDLSSNLFEWVDASREGAGWPELSCIIMGGSYVHYWGDVDCGEYSTLDWPCDAHHEEFGFRCCSK